MQLFLWKKKCRSSPFSTHVRCGKHSKSALGTLSLCSLNLASMKTPEPIASSDQPAHLPNLALIEQKLLDIYWHKKELDDFMPQLALNATPKELAAITLSQLAIIEKDVVQLLKHLAQSDNPAR